MAAMPRWHWRFCADCVAAANPLLVTYGTMSIQVIYQSLHIAKEPRFRIQDGGLFIETDSPMPVATHCKSPPANTACVAKFVAMREGLAPECWWCRPNR